MTGPGAGIRYGWIQNAAGYTLAIGGLIWVLYDVHPRELLANLTIRHWYWVALAIVADILAYVFQGWRWSLLLSPVGRVSSFKATEAIYAGLFTNEVLPLHLGELLRTYVVSRWLAVPFTAVIPSIALERLLDALWLAAGIGTVAILVPLPRSIENAADGFGIVVFVGAVVFAYLAYWRRRIAIPEKLCRASLISLLMISLQTLSFCMVVAAYGLVLPIWAGAAVFLIVHIGTAIPNAPGNVGSYQFFTVLGLTLFGVDKTAAAAFSFVVFFALTIPLWVIGFFAFTRTGVTFGRLRTEITRTPGITRTSTMH